ncbi:MAG TPA: hypothetical protein VJ400_01330 [Thermoplasmata archaeon]|nr:hypothetical protein [Thermoplasmata archaeon]
MLKVVIAGDRGSGKTTFLGMLYATGVRSGSDKRDEFRFHAPYESLEEITGLFERLMSGGFPDRATKEGIRGVKFQIGSRRSGLLSRFRDREWDPSGFVTVRFTLLRAVEEEVSRLLKGSVVAKDQMHEVLDGDVVAVLVDSTKLAARGERDAPSPMGKFDQAIEWLFAVTYRLGSHPGRNLIHPLFVFTKFDRVGRDVLRAAKVGAKPPPVGRRSERAAYAEALLRHNLPRTLARIRERDGGRVIFARPSYFFAWLRTASTGAGAPEKVLLRRVGVGGWEPEYSRDEYLAFLSCLQGIAPHVGG